MVKAKEGERILGILTCPQCGHKQEAEIPLDSCLPFYECLGCRQVIGAVRGCCVFCDYGDKPCPVSVGYRPAQVS